MSGGLLVAETPPQGFSISPSPSSTCSNFEVALSLVGENVTSEQIKVTDENNQTLLSSNFTFPAMSFSGVISKSIPIPEAAAKSSGLIGVSYWLNSQNEKAGRAEFFIVFDCEKNQVLFSCAETASKCPTDISEYFPKAQVTGTLNDEIIGEHISFSTFVFGKYTNDYEVLRIINPGELPLEIADVKIEGPNADEFQLGADYFNESHSQPVLLLNQELININIKFRPKRREGTRTASITVISSDPFNPQITIPIKGNVIFQEDLRVKLKDVKLDISGNSSVVSGKVIIDNRGSRSSKKGSTLSVALFDENSVREECDYENCGYITRYATTILKIAVPRLARTRKLVLSFKSKPLSNIKYRIDKGDLLLAKIQPKGREMFYGNNEFKYNLK